MIASSLHAGRNGSAVLLLHGLCGNPLELAPLARRLQQAGFTTDTPLLRRYGVGNDDARSRPRVDTCEQWIAAAIERFDALAASHDQVLVGGLCIGAVLSMALSLERRSSAMILVSPTLYFDGWNVSPWRRLLPLAYLPPLRHRLSFRETAPFGLKNERLRAWIQQAMQSEAVSAVGAASLPAAGLYQTHRLISRVRARLGELRQPAVILHATEDDVASPRSVHVLQARLACKPEVHWFHDSYHMLTLDNERAAVVDAATRFALRHLGAPLQRAA